MRFLSEFASKEGVFPERQNSQEGLGPIATAQLPTRLQLWAMAPGGTVKAKAFALHLLHSRL